MKSAVLALLTLLAGNQDPPGNTSPLDRLVGLWDARCAEHLWNRAGFGADRKTIARSVELGPEALVGELLTVDPWVEEPFYARKRADGDLGKVLRRLPEAEREERMRELRREDNDQAIDFLDWWIERMLAGEAPLVERMTLFWHGYFTSSLDVVKSSYEMIQQNQMFRRHALGSFRQLLYGVARDPAMLVYLDNASSRKNHPNENFARELLELFTLGESQYSENDVREVARAFTGWGQRNGRFQFDPRRHDGDKKRVLGVEGRLDGDDVLEIVLRQEACARHLARALLSEFEGVDPPSERLERYAARLLASDYRIDDFLRALFLDPEFYSAEKRGTRVAGPLDYLVGTARRLGAAPQPRLVVAGAGLLGQRPFYPPSVRGWEGGRSWATTSSLLLRGELAGLMLGRVSGRELVAELGRAAGDGAEPRAVSDGGTAAESTATEPTDAESMAPQAMTAGERPRIPPELRVLARMNSIPRLNLTQRLSRSGAKSDAELARALLDDLLAIPAPGALEEKVRERLTAAREAEGLDEAEWLDEAGRLAHSERVEPLLRALAHEILALPEAQLD